MSTRITADWDTRNKYDISYYLRDVFLFVRDIKSLEVKKSSKKGYHLIVWSGFNYKPRSVWIIRKKIHDDINRIRNDKLRKIGRQTLFDKKQQVKK